MSELRIRNEEELKAKLKEDIDKCGKEKVVIQAGHFPLLYLPHGAIEGVNHWGRFSTYSLELGCEIGEFARDLGRQVQFVFFADDHSYESLGNLGTKNQVAVRRRKLYREKSGTGAELPLEYQRIMEQFGFDESHVLRHDHGKNGRRNCLYFSEKILRDSFRRIENACAREYTAFIEDSRYFDKTKSHLISFVPNRCREHICDVALDEEIEGLSASHVFMETMALTASREELYSQGRGGTYRRD